MASLVKGFFQLTALKIISAATFFFMAGIFFSCGSSPSDEDRPAPAEPYYISVPICDVQRVLMHQRNEFTFLVRTPNSNNLYELYIDYLAPEKRVFIIDVPADKEMWLNFKCKVSCKEAEKNISAFRDYEKIEIHIHSARDIDGAGWNHGKYGSGQTTSVE